MTPLVPALTDREEQVLLMVADGYGVGEIAHRLGITTDTARKHRDNAVARMSATSQAHAVAMLIRRRSTATA